MGGSVHKYDDVGENEGEDAEPRDEEQLPRRESLFQTGLGVADAAQDVAEKSRHNVEDEVARGLSAQEVLGIGKLLNEIEHADHGSQHDAPHRHVEEHQENVVSLHAVKLVVTSILKRALGT